MRVKRIRNIYKIVPSSFKRSPLFWKVAGALARFYPDGAFRRIPTEVIIEPGNPCNLRCPVCPTHFAMKRQKGFMTFELYKEIIDDMKHLKQKPLISMSFAGEPLLNKDIVRFVEYAHQHGHKTFISTNVTLMTEQLSEGLIKAGLSSIHLCIDGFSKDSHEMYRVGSSFEVVKKNIETFLAVRSRLGSSTPHVSIQTLLTSKSEHEIDQGIAWAKRIGADDIYFKSLSMGSYTTEEMKKKYAYLLPEKKELRRKTTKVYKTICPVPQQQALVYWNGDLGLCCVDFDNVVKMPTIKEEGFLKTFMSDRAVKLRKAGFLKKFSLCKGCSLGNADSMGFSVDLKNA